MSYKALNWAWELEELRSSQKFVLIALADMADDKHSCFPGQDRLAAMTGMSVDTVSRAVRALERRGLLRRVARRRANGYRTSDRYFLQVDD